MDTNSEEWRRICEARYWVRQYQVQVKERGRKSADTWWRETKEKIGKVRGEASLQNLINDMNKEKNAKGGQS
jgi:hypothetical protein